MQGVEVKFQIDAEHHDFTDAMKHPYRSETPTRPQLKRFRAYDTTLPQWATFYGGPGKCLWRTGSCGACTGAVRPAMGFTAGFWTAAVTIKECSCQPIGPAPFGLSAQAAPDVKQPFSEEALS